MTSSFVWAAAALVFTVSGALAQTEPLYCPKTEKHVAVLGDSLADGLWGSLYRGWIKCETLKLYRVTEVSDGLTITKPEEWGARMLSSLGKVPKVDLVIVEMGANDIRPIRTDSGRVFFGTPEWNLAYSERAKTLLSAMETITSAVMWAGLPVVGDESLEASYTQVSALQADIVGDGSTDAKAAVFVDMHEATKFGNAGYVKSVMLDENLTQLRTSDQIHFTEKGYDLEVQVFRDELERRLKADDIEASLGALALQ